MGAGMSKTSSAMLERGTKLGGTQSSEAEEAEETNFSASLSTKDYENLREESMSLYNLTHEERVALDDWASSGYHVDINDYFRGDITLDELKVSEEGEVYGIYGNLMKAFDKSKPLGRDVVVTREVGRAKSLGFPKEFYSVYEKALSDSSSKKEFDNYVKSNILGGEITLKGLSSTSLGGDVSYDGNVKMFIKIPKGKNAGLVLDYSIDRDFKFEREMLLKRDSKVQVKRVETVGEKIFLWGEYM